jgi:hypothetical protein
MAVGGSKGDERDHTDQNRDESRQLQRATAST